MSHTSNNVRTKIWNKLFPQRHISNVWRFYVIAACNSAWFLAGNWIFYWLRFMNYGQLGIMDAICFAFGLVMEVPSGAIADIIGKRRTVISGMWLASIGFLFMGLATNLFMLWIGFLMAQAGWAFYSGAAEALVYDTMVDGKMENKFDQVISTSSSIATITSVIATLIGGVMYVLYYRSTHLGMAAAYFIAVLISYGLREPKTDTDKFSLRIWWRKLLDGSQQLLKPNLKPFAVVILMLMGAEVIYEWGLIKPAIATSFGFMDKEQAVIFALFGTLNALIQKSVPYLRHKISDKRGLYLLTIIMGIGFLMASLPLGYFGSIPMLLITLSGYLVYPWISVVVNSELDPQHRATALSTVALVSKIPYVMVAVLAGSMVESGRLWLFNLILGMVIIITLMANVAVNRLYMKNDYINS